MLGNLINLGWPGHTLAYLISDISPPTLYQLATVAVTMQHGTGLIPHYCPAWTDMTFIKWSHFLVICSRQLCEWKCGGGSSAPFLPPSFPLSPPPPLFSSQSGRLTHMNHLSLLQCLTPLSLAPGDQRHMLLQLWAAGWSGDDDPGQAQAALQEPGLHPVCRSR